MSSYSLRVGAAVARIARSRFAPPAPGDHKIERLDAALVEPFVHRPSQPLERQRRPREVGDDPRGNGDRDPFVEHQLHPLRPVRADSWVATQRRRRHLGIAAVPLQPAEERRTRVVRQARVRPARLHGGEKASLERGVRDDAPHAAMKWEEAAGVDALRHRLLGESTRLEVVEIDDAPLPRRPVCDASVEFHNLWL
jgi:hypothetical protein